MITLAHGDYSFNYRIVGVALHDGHVLLHHGESEDFWTLPGGRAELGELAEETLRREMREELGVEVEVERLLWVVENFFTYLGRSWHELAFYFAMTLPHDSPLYRRDEPFFGQEEFPAPTSGMTLIFQWHPVEGLDSVNLLPSFLRTGLMSPPKHTVHIVHTDA